MTVQYITSEAPLTGIDMAEKTITAIPQENRSVTQPVRLEERTPRVGEPLRVASARSLSPGRLARRSEAPIRLARRASEERSRLLIFAVNGMNVFAVGLLVQVILIRYADMGRV